MSANIVVPEVGESIVDARVAKWLKKEGDLVAAGDPLVELETDKIDLEVAAPQAGVLARIDHRDGADVKVGEVLGIIDEAAQGATQSSDTGAPAPSATQASSVQAVAGRGRAHPRDACRAQGGEAERGGSRAGAWQRRCRTRDAARRRAGGQAARRQRPRSRPCSGTRHAGTIARPGAAGQAGPARLGGSPSGRRRAGRRAHPDVEAPRHHRAASHRGPEHRGHADHLQRGGHVGRHGAPRASQADVQGTPRRQPWPVVVFREGGDWRAARVPTDQRRDPGGRDGAQALLRHRHRGRRGRRSRGAGAARRGPHDVLRRSSSGSARSPRRPTKARSPWPI